jgi:hypothetical protein
MDELARQVGGDTARRLSEISIALYERAARYARERGIVIADTKFEFGFEGDTLTWIDEALTPGFVALLAVSSYRAGHPQPSFDKQFLRDWLDASGWDPHAARAAPAARHHRAHRGTLCPRRSPSCSLTTPTGEDDEPFRDSHRRHAGRSPVTLRRALLSVTDKSGLAELGRALAARGVQLVASGGTAAHLEAAGLAVTAVEDVTHFPEMLGGRVKTLHPALHAGILADRGQAAHVADLEAHGLQPIDLLVVNFYDFATASARATLPIEAIDIGGPTLARAAAKNCAG